MATKLLAVDGSNIMRKVMEITFASDDFDLTVVEDADAALSALAAGSFQVIVSDTTFGEGKTDGYSLCEQAKGRDPSIKVMLLGSRHRPLDRSRSEAVGADESIDKPFDTQQVLNKVASLVDGAAGTTGAAPSPSLAAAARPSLGSPARPSLGAAKPATAAPAAPAFSKPAPASPIASPAASKPAVSAPAPRPAAAAAVAVGGAVAAKVDASLGAKLDGLGLSPEVAAAIVALSREVIEQVVWDVVPELAEVLIKEEIRRLTAEG